MRADELVADGDREGRAVWLKIVKAVEELLLTLVLRSASGYERTFSGPSTSVRFTLNFGHSRSEIALNAGLPRVGGRSEPKPLRYAFDPLRFPGDQAGAAPKCDVRPCPFHENH